MRHPRYCLTVCWSTNNPLLHHFFSIWCRKCASSFGACVCVCLRIYSCSSVYQCEWLCSFVKVWLWLCESPVKRETEILITRRGVLWTWFIGSIINGVRFSCHAWYFSSGYTWGTLLMNRQLERAPLCLLPDWSPFNSISVSLIKCKMNHQYLGPGNAEPVILIVIGWRELLGYMCVRLWPLITCAVYFLKPSINTRFEFLYLRNSWFWFSVDVSRLLCLMLMCRRLPKFGRVLIESFF